MAGRRAQVDFVSQATRLVAKVTGTCKPSDKALCRPTSAMTAGVGLGTDEHNSFVSWVGLEKKSRKRALSP